MLNCEQNYCFSFSGGPREPIHTRSQKIGVAMLVVAAAIISAVKRSRMRIQRLELCSLTRLCTCGAAGVRQDEPFPSVRFQDFELF